MPMITNDGRKIGLDQRLMNPDLPDEAGTKINLCVDNVFNIWKETSDKRSAQLIFSDLGVPQTADKKSSGKRFCVYDDIKEKLIAKGVPAEEIAFIHDAKTETAKDKLFEKVRKGDVRVLIGSTSKMGAGTNVQNKLIASHDLDAPWKPSDMEQRRGRMVRQGNENDEVRLFRYVTEGTFDSYLYQIRFFNQEQIQIIEEEAVKCYKNGKRIYRIGEIIIFLLNVGLRIGEALALEWSDIDFDKKYVKIRKNVVFVKVRDESNSSYNYHIVEQNAPKTKSGNRIVPLNSAALKALKSLYAINGKHKYVFSTSNGNRVYPRNVDRMFRSVLKKCCIKPTGVHTLRHTFASRLFAKGVDVKTVSELLGHSEVSITYDTYIHLIQEQHVVAVETLEDLYNVL